MPDASQKALTLDAIYRRAAARGRYNKLRRAECWMRRLIIEYRILNDPECSRRGWCADLARELGVSRSTLSRDIAAVLANDINRSTRISEECHEVTSAPRRHRNW